MERPLEALKGCNSHGNRFTVQCLDCRLASVVALAERVERLEARVAEVEVTL